MSTWNWYCRKSSTKVDNRVKLHRKEVPHHPLQQFIEHVNKNAIVVKYSSKNGKPSSKSDSTIISDPLGVILDGNDPLRMFQKQTTTNTDNDNDWDTYDAAGMIKYTGLEPWSLKKESVLSKFSTNEILSMTSCFSLQDKGTSILKGKFEPVDDFEDGIIFEINDITPSDFYRRLESFNNEIIRAWNEDQRVKALKIVIQCSKLLSDSFAYSFYPNKYIYVTDMLDKFGNLVYTRLRAKCDSIGKREKYGKNIKKFPDNFTLEMVPEEAKETCLNWFYKIASIRELIPRLYIEAALLKSYSFIRSGENGKILMRLTKMVRGVGDPLVALYLRCYLCRVGVEFGADNFDFFTENFYEFVSIYYKIFNPSLHLNKTKELVKYIDAFTPPLEWIIQGMVSNADDNIQQKLIDSCQKVSNNTLLLYALLTSLKNDYVINNFLRIVKWISLANYDEVPLYKLLLQLGRCYQTYSTEDICIGPVSILEEVWLLIYKIDVAAHYMLCVNQWLPLSITNLSVRNVNYLLGDVIKHITNDRSSEQHYSQLENIVRTLTGCIEDFMSLLITENFLPFLSLLRSETVKVTVCKTIMEEFVKRSYETFINDAVILNNLMIIAKALHDSMNALTVDDEKRQIGSLISTFVRRIDFGRDFEQQLEFYVEARGAFFNLDVVHVTLVQCVNKLSFKTLEVVKGRHTSKTSAFVRACSAYCFITIPSISSSLSRLQLYIISGQTALANQCLGQADACFKAILDVIAEFSDTTRTSFKEKIPDNILASYIREFLSILLVVPDNPSDHGSLFLIRSLINVLEQHSWEEDSSNKFYLYIDALHLLSVAYQDQYPYHFYNVDSNDILYASDLMFREEIHKICSVILEQILKHLKTLGMSEQIKKQAKLTYELFFCVILRTDVSNKEMTKLSLNLWNLANKSNTINKSVAFNLLKHSVHCSPINSMYREIFTKLIEKLQ